MTRIANSTEAVRRTKLLDRIQAEDFARAWREGRREEVLANVNPVDGLGFIRVHHAMLTIDGQRFKFWSESMRVRMIADGKRIKFLESQSCATPGAEPPSGFDSPSPEGGSCSRVGG